MSLDYTSQVERMIGEWGAALMGVADAQALQPLQTFPAGLLDPFTKAVSIAVQIPSLVFETVSGQPTPLYARVYETANRLLDEIALRTANMLESDGYITLPIPASQILDRDSWSGAISHKAVAIAAGLGWQGKSLLLVTPQFGPRVRLVTLLTNAPLEVSSPVRNRCGDCTRCQEACPVGAIKGVGTEFHYESRFDALHLDRCAEKLTKEFAQLPHVGSPICGICIKVCPYGRKVKKGQSLFGEAED